MVVVWGATDGRVRATRSTLLCFMESLTVRSTAELLGDLDFQRLCRKVDTALAPHGFEVIGTRTFIPARFQRKRQGICSPEALSTLYDYQSEWARCIVRPALRSRTYGDAL